MRKITLLVLLAVFVISAKTQTYDMSTTTVSTCSGVFYDSGSSTGNYANSQNLIMTFNSDNGNRISFNFQSFSLYSDGYDYLEIYDGSSILHPLLGTYFGTNSPGVVTSTGTSLTFKFYSNSSYTGTGWSANISCTTAPLSEYPMSSGTINTCTGLFFDNGGSATNYSNNENREMTFCSNSANYIIFNFTHFNISTDDTLFIYDGSSSSSPLIGIYSGNRLPETIYSKSGSCVTFKFVSNSVNNSSGWRALISCSSAVPLQNFAMQNGIRYTCGGTFYDSGEGGTSYSNSENYVLTFSSANGNRLSFNFQSFSLYADGYDYLEIYDGPSTSYPLLGTYFGSNSPGIVTSTGTKLTFKFYSNSSYASSGWSANISCTSTPLTEYSLSNTAVNTCSGLFFDSGGPAANYPHNENTTMTFCSSSSNYIIFNFTHFNVAIDDTLFVYDGNTIAANIIGKYNGNQLPENIYSISGNCLTFKFVSNTINSSTGWRGFISCSATPPSVQYTMQNGVRYTCGGSFYDSGGLTSSYSNNESTTMTFISSNGKRIQFEFSTFSLYSDGYDYIDIYDGPSIFHTLIGRYYSTSNPGIVSSTGTSLTFRFYSNSSYTSAGWSANISCTTDPIPWINQGSASLNICEAVFFDSGGSNASYQNNENSETTLCSGNSNFIVANFTHFDIYAGDTLFIYDGANSLSPLIGKYYGSRLPETISSKSGTCLTFKFLSNSANVSSGWRALISCSASLPAQNFSMQNGIRYTCGGNFYDSGGPTSNYLSSESHYMTYYSDNGNRLSFNFSSFSSETNIDRLYVYDGPSSSYPLLGIYSGSTNPGAITSTGNSLTFYFYSDGSTTYSGWAATINCTSPVLPYFNMSSGTVNACEGVFFDNGGGNNNYPNNENREMTFCSDSGKVIFNFTHFAIDMTDTLFVYDGANSSSPLIGKYYGLRLPETISSKSGSCLTFKFVSNSSNVSTGWRALISCSASLPTQNFAMQNGVRYTCGGNFYDSGGLTANFSNSESYYMTFFSENGNRLSFNFSSFTTETNLDKLYIYDGPTNQFPLLGIYSGSSNPGIITSTGNSLTFYFYSDGITTYSGWAATINCTSPVLPYFNMSSGTVNACEGVFFDNGGGNNNYPNNENREMTFCSDSGKILFNFSHFSVDLSDTLYAYDGNSDASPLIGKYTGYNIPETIFSETGSCVTFKFVSNAVNVNSGWRAIISCTNNSVVQNFIMSDGVRYTCGGNFYDSGGQLYSYSNSENRTMTFVSETNSRLQFNFSSFSTETNIDRLYVYDGPSVSYPIIGTYSGSSNPGIITSTGNNLTFKFTSDGSTVYSGWAATINCTTPALTSYNMTSGNVNTCSGVFYDNAGANTNYPHNENRIMTFCSDTGNFIKFSFTNNNFGISTEDSLFVYDGSSVSGNPLAIYTGYSSPGEINSLTGSCLTFKFVSNTVTNAIGWQAIISCIDTINTIPVINMGDGVRYTCTGKFYDSGGISSSYSNSENKTMTIYSNSGCPVTASFSAFYTESSFDKLFIYDGPNVSSTLMGTYSGTTSPGSKTSTGNCLTFKFTSDGSTVYSGWTADISCEIAGITATPSTNVCMGDTITLTASTGSSYIWSNGQTSQNIKVTSSGIYSVTVTNSNGCNLVSNPITVNFKALPGNTITINGNTTFCSGSSVQLSAPLGSSYLWSNGATTQSINVSLAGNYSATVTNTQACSSKTDTVVTNVLSLPNSTISNSGANIFCQGDSIVLSANDGVSWLWNNGLNTQQIIVKQSGTYYVQIIGTNGCSVQSNSIQIVVSTYPTSEIFASGPTTFCQGLSVNLTASVASSYLWSTGAVSQTISVTQSGIYYLTLTNSGNCSTISDTIQVTVNPLPNTPVITQNGDTLYTNSGFSNYTWKLNSSIVQSGSLNSFVPSISGNYFVEVTDNSNCTAISNSYYYQSTFSENIFDKEFLNIYPNPFNIETEIYFSNNLANNTKVRFYDTNGRLIFLKHTVQDKSIKVYRENIKSGIYHFEIINNNQIMFKGNLIVID